MKNDCNKFGVEYHSYTLTLADNSRINFDMAWEDTWGDVVEWNDIYDGGEDNTYVAYGNEDAGFKKIIKVIDDENGLDIDVWEFYRRCYRETDKYSE